LSYELASNLGDKRILCQFLISDIEIQEIFINSKADKIAFETIDSWILVDTQELLKYFKSNNSQKQHLDDLIKKLEWNIIIYK